MNNSVVPLDLIPDICSYLEVPDLAACRLVGKVFVDASMYVLKTSGRFLPVDSDKYYVPLKPGDIYGSLFNDDNEYKYLIRDDIFNVFIDDVVVPFNNILCKPLSNYNMTDVISMKELFINKVIHYNSFVIITKNYIEIVIPPLYRGNAFTYTTKSQYTINAEYTPIIGKKEFHGMTLVLKPIFNRFSGVMRNPIAVVDENTKLCP